MTKGTRKYVTELSVFHGLLKESPEERAQTPLTLMLLGKTGNGKSSLGNALLGRKDPETAPFQPKAGMVACEDYEPHLEEGQILNRQVSVIDTPGVLDNVNVEQALDGICKAIFLSPNGVTAFVIALRADVRFTKEESEAVMQLQNLFGDNFWEHTICVFTHGDAVLKNGRVDFLDSLKPVREQLPNLDKLLKSVGARVMIVNCDDISENELTEFVMLLDSVRNKNEDKCYTNAVFKEAQLRYEMSKGAALMASQRKAKKELRKLEAAQNEQGQAKIAELQEKVKAQEMQIQTLKDEVVKAAKTVAKKSCTIL